MSPPVRYPVRKRAGDAQSSSVGKTHLHYFAAARIPQWLLDAFAAFVQRQTYICQAELLAYLCAYLTFSDLLQGQLIHHRTGCCGTQSCYIQQTV